MSRQAGWQRPPPPPEGHVAHKGRLALVLDNVLPPCRKAAAAAATAGAATERSGTTGRSRIIQSSDSQGQHQQHDKDGTLQAPNACRRAASPLLGAAMGDVISLLRRGGAPLNFHSK